MSKINFGKVQPKPRGDYEPTKAYEFLNIVTLDGRSYICNDPDGAPIGFAPSDRRYWQSLNGPGEKGEKGDKGDKGDKGNKGDTGDGSTDTARIEVALALKADKTELRSLSITVAELEAELETTSTYTPVEPTHYDFQFIDSRVTSSEMCYYSKNAEGLVTLVIQGARLDIGSGGMAPTTWLSLGYMPVGFEIRKPQYINSSHVSTGVTICDRSGSGQYVLGTLQVYKNGDYPCGVEVVYNRADLTPTSTNFKPYFSGTISYYAENGED